MLEELVRRIRSARDTARLFAALGYSPGVRHIEGDTWAVAHWKTFQIVAKDSPNPGADARQLATLMAVTSRRALAVAVGPGEITFSAPNIGTSTATKVQRVDLATPGPSGTSFLEALRPQGATALAHALRVAELLSAETVTERFFTAFHKILGRMSAAVPGRASEADRRTAALLPLTRVLFLYFVQARGWLDGKPDYLRRLLDSSLAARRHFHRSALHPLFFGTLNRRAEARSGVARLGVIPYLNGGLFEPHPVERRLGSVCFANELWRDAFDLLFERFRFCVREADEADAVAPDMLGRVFERVMDAADRQGTGTFYTPEFLVRQIVTATIDVALGGRDPAAVLPRLRILDPAVGSGAFLLGVLDRLTDMRCGAAAERARIRREILARNLFGVDLSPIAVRLAELRLWLAVIADDPATDISRVTPLPNLDGVVRQGDSLLDPLSLARVYAGPNAPPVALARAVSLARRRVFSAPGALGRDAARQLRAEECRLAAELIRAAIDSVSGRLRDLASRARSRDLFGARGMTAAQRRQYRSLIAHRRNLRRARRALDNGQLPFFAFEVHAAEVMAAGGFDIVLGNPPWVRAERLPPEIRRQLRDRFNWWRPSGGAGYAHLPDLSVAFIERAVELAAPGGVVGLLVPAKLTSAAYAGVARRHLVAETRIHYLHRVSDRDAAAFHASIYPLAMVLHKGEPPAEHRVALAFDGPGSVPQNRLSGPGPWILLPDRRRDALEQLRSAGRPLGEVARPALGVKSGADELFVCSVLERAGGAARVRLAEKDINIEWDLLRPVVRGRDVRAFRVHLKRAIIWTHGSGGAPLESLPPLAAAHFRGHVGRLRSRADYREGPPWMLFRIPPAEGSRVVWSDIARRPAAAALEACGVPRAVALNTCYILTAEDTETALVVTATFNSVWCAALARAVADEAQNGFRRINARVASVFPIPADGPATRRLLELSTQMHEQHDNRSDDLDDAVADALDLPSGVRATLRSLAADLR